MYKVAFHCYGLGACNQKTKAVNIREKRFMYKVPFHNCSCNQKTKALNLREKRFMYKVPFHNCACNQNTKALNLREKCFMYKVPFHNCACNQKNESQRKTFYVQSPFPQLCLQPKKRSLKSQRKTFYVQSPFPLLRTHHWRLRRRRRTPQRTPGRTPGWRSYRSCTRGEEGHCRPWSRSSLWRAPTETYHQYPDSWLSKTIGINVTKNKIPNSRQQHGETETD